MSIFPFLDAKIDDTTTLTTTTQQNLTALPPKEYAWDFETGDFILKDGKFVVVEGIEAIKVWIYKALNTERYKYLGYSWNYGNELENLIGGQVSSNFIESEAKRYIEEALSPNPYIQGIRDIATEYNDNHLQLEFTVITTLGEVKINV